MGSWGHDGVVVEVGQEERGGVGRERLEGRKWVGSEVGRVEGAWNWWRR